MKVVRWIVIEIWIFKSESSKSLNKSFPVILPSHRFPHKVQAQNIICSTKKIVRVFQLSQLPNPSPRTGSPSISSWSRTTRAQARLCLVESTKFRLTLMIISLRRRLLGRRRFANPLKRKATNGRRACCIFRWGCRLIDYRVLSIINIIRRLEKIIQH